MNLGMPEMIFLGFLGLLLFGPKKLPEIGRHLGRAMAEFKRASNEFQNQLQEEVRQLELDDQVKQIKAAAQPIGTAAREMQESITSALSDTSKSVASAVTDTPTGQAKNA